MLITNKNYQSEEVKQIIIDKAKRYKEKKFRLKDFLADVASDCCTGVNIWGDNKLTEPFELYDEQWDEVQNFAKEIWKNTK